MEIIQMNKFSYLSNNQNIFFSKIDLVDLIVEKIKNINNECLLIIGNGDLPFTNEIEKKIPKNVVNIYAQNNVSNSNRVKSLPLGIGNSEPCKISGHGEYWVNINEKLRVLENIKNIPKEELSIYCNFNDYTNPEHRILVKSICNKTNFINVEKDNLSYQEYINKCLKYSCAICPIGNGLDTHRVWEMLYCKIIPIIFRVDKSRCCQWDKNIKIGIYNDLYEKLPIIILDNEYEIEKKDILLEKFKESYLKWKDIDLINYTFWEKKIILDYKNLKNILYV
jgi:hypothetical protein